MSKVVPEIAKLKEECDLAKREEKFSELAVMMAERSNGRIFLRRRGLFGVGRKMMGIVGVDEAAGELYLKELREWKELQRWNEERDAALAVAEGKEVGANNV